MIPADIIPYIDLTSLNEDDTEEKIAMLCQKAQTPLGNVAAVCLYPAFVATAWKNLIEPSIKIATVANFPSGHIPIKEVSQIIKKAILDGAAEIDVVIPPHDMGNFIAHCKMLCGDKTLLKVILETGILSPIQIQEYSEIAIENGADFLKTSTGKIPQGATIAAATTILETIKRSQKPIGFKVSGGVKTVKEAQAFIELFIGFFGKEALSPARFRIGASTLLENILQA
jgi:deoxyribose-phosphate aldolase